MDRAAGESISAVANTMRRELAKLHQQASAFERTLEDQRRERTDALDRAERATEHALSLEARIARMEEESQQLRRLHETALDDLQKMRAERDDLARAVEGAKQSTEDMARLKAELDEVRKREHQEAAKGSDKDAEIATLTERAERLTAELASATKAKESAERERLSAEAERERLEKQLATARAAEAELVRVRQSLESAEKAIEQAVSESARLAREVEAARQDRDAHVERAALIERENVDLRLADEQMRRQLDGALQAAMHAEARANVAERARVQVEDGVRLLRDEITTAFARIPLVVEPDSNPSLTPSSPVSRSIPAPNTTHSPPPEWLRGTPTTELLEALSQADYDDERPVFDVARAWERDPLCRVLLNALASERDSRAREHHAWLVKNLAAGSMWKDIAAIATNDGETTGVRRWLLEALGRLVAERLIGWAEVGDVVRKMAKHPDATLRDGNIGILMSLPPSDEKKDVLLDIIAEEDDEVVLVGAIDALASSSPVELDELDENVLTRLLEHPSDRVQRAAKQLLPDILGDAPGDGATIDVE